MKEEDTTLTGRPALGMFLVLGIMTALTSLVMSFPIAWLAGKQSFHLSLCPNFRNRLSGARVVYLYGGEDYPIFLITVYAKAEKGNLSKAEQNALAKMAKSFFADYRGTR